MSRLQVTLFEHIKSALPSHLSLADEVAEALDVSIDSAYRRIRGEKQLSFEEIQKLSDRFRVSVDSLLNLKNDTILFTGDLIRYKEFDFSKYLDDIYSNIAYIASFEQKE